MKKKVSEALADQVAGAITGAYDFAKDVNDPTANFRARRKTGLSAEQQQAYEIFRKNFINDIADLIDYGIDRNQFTLLEPTEVGSQVAAQRKASGTTTYSYPSDFKGSRTWTSTKDWLEAYRDELAAIANKEPEPPPPPKPQIKAQMSLDIDPVPEPGQIPAAGALGTNNWSQFDVPAYKRKRAPRPVSSGSAPNANQMTTPSISEPVTWLGVKYYKVNGRWVNNKGKAADKNTSDLLDRVPLGESFPVTAKLNGTAYTRIDGKWYSESYKAEGELEQILNESYMNALINTINYKNLDKKYLKLLESETLPSLGDYLYNNLVKKHVESNNLPPTVKSQINDILSNLHKNVDNKDKTQLTRDIENMALLIFKNSYNLMPRLMRKSKP
jgi:hypothetical protein